MKKKFVLFIALLICFTTFLAACGGNPSLESMRQKFKDEGYHTTIMSNADIDKIAGLSEGFYARMGMSWNEEISESNKPAFDIRVWIYKFNKEELAKEFSDNASKNYAVSIEGIFVCRVQHYDLNEYIYLNDSTELQAAIDIFNRFF